MSVTYNKWITEQLKKRQFIEYNFEKKLLSLTKFDKLQNMRKEKFYM